jgi:tripartite-type tricarboxylate transporter receptor subunit TctC
MLSASGRRKTKPNASARLARPTTNTRRRKYLIGATFQDFSAVLYSKEEQTPEAVTAKLTSEIERWAPIIKKAGVYAD